MPSGTSLRGLKVRVFPLRHAYEQVVELDVVRTDLQAKEGRHRSWMGGVTIQLILSISGIADQARRGVLIAGREATSFMDKVVSNKVPL